jgi:hydrogenase expression/formation protein HypC
MSVPVTWRKIMCLAIPGKIESIVEGASQMDRMAKVNFGGVGKNVSLAYVPEARVGEYVIVHVGFALSVIDEAEAMKVFEYLKEMDDLQELALEDEGGRKKEEGVG